MAHAAPNAGHRALAALERSGPLRGLITQNVDGLHERAGQQQLVAVARAVIHKPSILLADEPTGNLHTAQGAEIMELFTRLNKQGTTIIQVTHSETNAAYGNRIINLKDGWIV